VSLRGFWAPAVDVHGQPATLGMNAEFARVAAPLVRPEEGGPLWLGIGKFGRLELATDAILPDSLQPVPDQLWLVETGVMHVRPLASGGSLGGTFLFGSASDRPYAAGRDLTLMAVAFYNRPARNDRDEWSFSVFYSPTSQLPYPLPGAAYVWRPDATLEAKIGLPAAIEYRPDDDWTFTANYFPLVNFAATARRRLAENLAFLAYYRTDTQIFFLADRLLDDERFYVFDQRAAVRAGVHRGLPVRPEAFPRHELHLGPHRRRGLRPRPGPLAPTALAAVAEAGEPDCSPAGGRQPAGPVRGVATRSIARRNAASRSGSTIFFPS
jgi:hypothetical protein